ncbi:MAG: PQQ-dependent sugar dehydrogenase, partial [Pseudomonadota bacterium]
LAAGAAAADAQRFDTEDGPVLVEAVAGPFDEPWGFAFLPEPGAMLVTEIGGDLRLVRDGRISAPLAGVPRVVARGQGGLLDVAVAPDFAETQTIYLTYSEPADGGARTALATARLETGATPRLTDLRVVFRQQPAFPTTRHFGSRIVFDSAGHVFVTLGDRARREIVPRLDNHLGKVVRLNRDGSVPADNPFVGRRDALPEIYSFGHRNAQGAALRPSDGAYFTISHGAAGGDEVNRPIAGANFGWPEVSYGRNYSGAPFPAASRADVIEPLYYWDPSIAPSGAAFYDGDLFPAWRGDLFVGALRGQHIARLELDGDRIVGEERLFEFAFGRVRDVRSGPDGALWFAIDDANGFVYRVTPAR